MINFYLSDIMSAFPFLSFLTTALSSFNLSLRMSSTCSRPLRRPVSLKT